jgi:ADP-dependent NAD(P)H-hydrate dehydratase
MQNKVEKIGAKENRRTIAVTPALLGRWGLPRLDKEDDKEDRGKVLIVGGSSEMPGAVMLAATAALRAGAGKLQIATTKSIAPAVAASILEARVFALPETKSGAFAQSAAKEIVEHASRVQAALIGPGMVDERATAKLMKEVLSRIKTPTLIIDAAALAILADAPDALHHLNGRVIITPHAGEMANALEMEKDFILRERVGVAKRAAKEFRAVVALKGAETIIASSTDDKIYANRTGDVGLATSGSGDTLSGIITGLAARGAAPVQAAVWGVHLHAAAGDVLSKRIGRVGFLARELLAEIPALVSRFEKKRK